MSDTIQVDKTSGIRIRNGNGNADIEATFDGETVEIKRGGITLVLRKDKGAALGRFLVDQCAEREDFRGFVSWQHELPQDLCNLQMGGKP